MPRQKDEAEKQTDDLLDELERRIKREYSKALKEIQEKYDSFAKEFQNEDERKKEQLANGIISKEAYQKWRKEQLYLDRRYKELASNLASDLTKVDQKVMSIINGYMPEAYALNFNYSTYEIEQGTGANTSFSLYSRDTVERLFKQGDIKLPNRDGINVPVDQRWNLQHINSAILQGVLQGESIPDISKRLQQVTNMDDKVAVRNARTMMTGAQNAGRLDAYERADRMGIKIEKEWMATLDSRTRDSHQRLDGERVDWKKAFSNDLMYPGDPDGDPSEVYNCRCTMVPFYPEYADIAPQKRMTYNEWKNGKKTIEEKISENKNAKVENPAKIIFNSKEKKEYDQEKDRIYREVGKMSSKDGFKTVKNFYEKYQGGEADENTFFTQTMAEFKEVLKKPDREPDYTSSSGSKYWYSKDGVIRGADHWGDGVASCSWALKGEKEEYYGNSWLNNTGERYGFAEWSEFVKMPQMIAINDNEFILTTFENNQSLDILEYKGEKYLIFRGKAIKTNRS